MSAGQLTPGVRRDLRPGESVLDLMVGEYGRHADRGGEFYARVPTGDLCDLSRHEITEHEDRTITVVPSIGVSDSERTLWHGHLERGVWREQ